MVKNYLISGLVTLSYLGIYVAFLHSCDGSSSSNSSSNVLSKAAFLENIEKENNISFTNIEIPGAYIPPQCYTKTEDENGTVHNPCYTCHTQGKPPNFWNDVDLQESYDFPEKMLINPYKNLFIDKTDFINSISDDQILNYIRQSNYFDTDGEIKLQKVMPRDWLGYVPDCYFNFDNDGFDINPKTNSYTGWVAYKYYSFLGTFWPTNGSTDDVLIRLPQEFRLDNNGNFNKEVYKINISILETIVKQQDVELDYTVDETKFGVDLDKDGKLSKTNRIKFSLDLKFIGKARELQSQNKIKIEPGLFPVGTEFIHTVRYIDFDDSGNIKLSPRIKEVRYAYKEEFFSTSEIKYMIDKKYLETHPNFNQDPNGLPPLEGFPGNFEKGLKNMYGWRYSGYIEDKNGNLRPQTTQELTSCMGCHDTIGATTDSIFSFSRKFAFGYWNNTYLKNVPEPVAEYKKFGKQYEYTFYLKNNKSGNEFRTNKEVESRFFNQDGSLKEEMIKKLHNDISLLLYPSKERALLLNKAYLWVVKNQKYRYGNMFDAISLDKTVHKQVKPKQTTGIVDLIY
ncbi:hypothetical protein [Sulfurihydrogenibium sp.]|uniref:hypothetical protein n=1 Tax=Sulfurihydrogenibium sp. TaxID=2053621 RepID=UPI0026173CFE|nr:hypothetical protein [Sulfurihydrogenibium sp.]